jgi:hypothetical protein
MSRPATPEDDKRALVEVDGPFFTKSLVKQHPVSTSSTSGSRGE